MKSLHFGSVEEFCDWLLMSGTSVREGSGDIPILCSIPEEWSGKTGFQLLMVDHHVKSQTLRLKITWTPGTWANWGKQWNMAPELIFYIHVWAWELLYTLNHMAPHRSSHLLENGVWCSPDGHIMTAVSNWGGAQTCIWLFFIFLPFFWQAHLFTPSSCHL